MTIRTLCLAFIGLSIAVLATADSHQMTLTSDDISHGSFMAKAQEFEGFGCDGDDQSPHLAWSGAPEGTKTFAVFAYDPDAPPGSGCT